MLTVRDIMNSSVVTVGPDLTARQLARLLADEEISGAPVRAVVIESTCPLGIVTSGDVLRAVADGQLK